MLLLFVPESFWKIGAKINGGGNRRYTPACLHLRDGLSKLFQNSAERDLLDPDNNKQKRSDSSSNDLPQNMPHGAPEVPALFQKTPVLLHPLLRYMLLPIHYLSLVFVLQWELLLTYLLFSGTHHPQAIFDIAVTNPYAFPPRSVTLPNLQSAGTHCFHLSRKQSYTVILVKK